MDGNENSFEERSVEELLEYLECKCLDIENQQVAFISTVLRFYGVEVLNLEGLSTSLWVDNAKGHSVRW